MERGWLMRNFLKKVGAVAVCLGLSLPALTGCQRASPEEARLQRVVQNLFSGPQEAQRELLQAMSQDPGAHPNGAEDYQATLESQFDPEGFSEDYYAGLGAEILQNMRFPQMCALYGAQLEPGPVELEVYDEENRVYAFSLEVTVTQDGEEELSQVSGRVQTDGEGLVSWISPDTSLLLEALMP